VHGIATLWMLVLPAKNAFSHHVLDLHVLDLHVLDLHVLDLRSCSIQEGVLSVKQIFLFLKKIQRQGLFAFSIPVCVQKIRTRTTHTHTHTHTHYQEEIIGRGHRQQLHVRMTMSKGIMLGMN
jgi:hypothetical protein